MESLFEAGLAASRWLQESYPGLLAFMRSLNVLGQFESYLAISLLLYWSVDKRFGKHLLYLLAVSNVANGLFKSALRGPRPFWFDESLKLTDDVSYGLPSAHAQTAMLFFGFVAYRLRRGWFWLLALLLVGLLALSQLYLGAHFIHDVVLGFGLAILALLGYGVWRRYFYDGFRNRIMGQRLLAVVVLPLAVGIVWALVLLLVGPPKFDLAWDATLARDAEIAGYTALVNRLALLFGLGVGFIFEVSRVRFLEAGRWWQHGLRFVGGLAAGAALVLGLGSLLPADPLWLALPLRFGLNILLGLWLAYYWPMIFVKLNLAEAAPEPEVRLTVNRDGLLKG